MINVELNANFTCNLTGCAGCDRLVGVYTQTDEMTAEQVASFIELAVQKKCISRLKWVGGEPWVHTQAVDIYGLLSEGVGRGAFGSVKIDSNGTLPIPEVAVFKGVRFSGRKPKKKIHLPILWAPCDLGLDVVGPCSHPKKCGYSIDSRGWQLCSPGIMIDRLFYGGSHYRAMEDFPTAPWSYEALCKFCLYAAPAAFREANARPISQFTPEMKSPTRSWTAALRGAGVQVAGVYQPRVP